MLKGVDSLSNYGADLDNRKRTRQGNKCYVDIQEDVKICQSVARGEVFTRV